MPAYAGDLYSLATTEHKIRNIDPLLTEYYRYDSTKSVFSFINVECRHRKHIWAVINPTKNEYEFWVVEN